MPAELRPAATTLVLRDTVDGPEVFMVRRHDRAAFMAGAFVFPGGAVDPSDGETASPAWCDGAQEAALRIPDLAPDVALGFHVAAARELFEEAGVLVARHPGSAFVEFTGASWQRFARHRQDVHGGRRTLRDVLGEEELRLAVDALVVCAHWVTPPLDTRRFDTRFFATALPAGQQPGHDDRETTGSLWIRAADAIAAGERREMILPPPTWVMLRELTPFASVAAVLDWARQRTIRRREPAVSQVEGKRALVMGDGLEGDSGAEQSTFVWDGDRWLPRELNA